jgi:glycosyltransferase involved in cell wall biosynthesis
MTPLKDPFSSTLKKHVAFEAQPSAASVAEFELKLDEGECRTRDAAWPRISIVTAVHNGAAHLEETICSLLDQRYPNLEYIVVDDGSTDRTPEIIKRYEKHLAWRRQENAGMYAALNAGFRKASGEIMGWLNDSDKLHTGALLVIGSVFSALPEVDWITGRPTWFNEEGMTVAVGEPPHWSRYRFLAGANRYIQQESTFWRRRLWAKAGGYVDDSGECGHVADFELWVRFFRHAKLYPVDALIGGFRKDKNSRGLQNLERCHEIHERIVDEELRKVRFGKLLKTMREIGRKARARQAMHRLWHRLVMQNLYNRPGGDWPPVIRFQGNRWVMSNEAEVLSRRRTFPAYRLLRN